MPDWDVRGGLRFDYCDIKVGDGSLLDERGWGMIKVGSNGVYDFYIWDDGFAPIYNIVPCGSRCPDGGYYSKEWIERVKGTKFPVGDGYEDQGCSD